MSASDAWTKPTIILVPGAWNTDGSFNLLYPLLEGAGYKVRCVSLPSVGADPPVDNMTPDINAIRTVLEEEIEAGQDVMLVMHDYASVPAGEAVKSLDKATRLRHGLSGGVSCLFYAASPILSSGSCFAEVFDHEDRSWLVISRDRKVVIAEKPKDMLCPEVEPELAQEFVSSLRPHSYQPFFSKTTCEPYREIPFFCLFCRLDKVISLEKQQTLAAAVGVKFRSSTINTGHCPFVGQPEDMAKAIRRAAKESTYYSGIIARDYGFRATQ